MARVCSPGGKSCFSDLDGQLVWHFPEDAELQLATERVLSHLASTVLTLLWAETISVLCLGTTLTDIRVQVDPYHLYAGPHR